MKNKFLNSLIIITLILVAFIVYDKFKLSQNSHFTVTADTVIKPGSEISKYVTQEEVDSFALRYWDIDEDAKYSNDNIDENITQKTLRSYLKAKDTNSLLNFIKDNNLSVDTRMMYNLTPLMYASFYDDEKTMEELLNLGANPNLKDSYNLSPLAYAIENNSTKTFKLLLDNGAIFDEDMIVQNYLNGPSYIWIKKIIIDGDDIKIEYRSEYGTKQGKGVDPASAITYMVDLRLVEILQTLFDSGYKIKSPIDKNCAKSFRDKFRCSYYYYLTTAPDYKKPLNILLDNNISMPVDDEFLKSEYEKCYESYKDFPDIIQDYIERIEVKGRAEYIIERRFVETNNISWSEIYKTGYLNLNPRPANNNVLNDIKRDMAKYREFCSDKNSTFKSAKEYINYKNWSNKKYAIDMIKNRYPEKIYLKDENMTLRQYIDKIYENYLNENRGKNGKKLK